MRRFAAHAPIPDDARGCAIALGNFDGVHIGHQAVIASAREAAQRLNASLALAAFSPNPLRYFRPDGPPLQLQTPDQRACAAAKLGVAAIFEIPFDAHLAQMTDESFAQEILRQRLGAVHVSVGADFRFGRARMGDSASLTRLGARFGFSVDAVTPVGEAQTKISSSSIRSAIAAGELTRAAALLTRPWAIEGVIQRGFQRGRGFGFATANIALGDYVRPRLGIYAVRAHVGGAVHDGVASVGVNPTVGALPEPLLEAHLFDFDQTLYGQRIEVEMVAFLRDEAHFDSVDALKAQMTRDAENAKAALRV